IFKRQRPVLALTYETGLGNRLTLFFFCSQRRQGSVSSTEPNRIPQKTGTKGVRRSSMPNWNAGERGESHGQQAVTRRGIGRLNLSDPCQMRATWCTVVQSTTEST